MKSPARWMVQNEMNAYIFSGVQTVALGRGFPSSGRLFNLYE